jgi:hypothetical protein
MCLIDMFRLRLFSFFQDVGLWLEVINLGSYRQIFKENGVNGEYLEGMSMFTTEQILRFIRRCHMKWGDFITLCKELRRIKGISLSLLYASLLGFWEEGAGMFVHEKFCFVSVTKKLLVCEKICLVMPPFRGVIVRDT